MIASQIVEPRSFIISVSIAMDSDCVLTTKWIGFHFIKNLGQVFFKQYTFIIQAFVRWLITTDFCP